MATTNINVTSERLSRYFDTAKTKPFVIPEYQRPYAWTEEHVETLFNDLWEFTETQGGSSNETATYFLGSIVSYDNEDKKCQEIIDGQQRITSLFLLLRAIYTKLAGIPENEPKAKNFMRQIEPLLWRADKLTGEIDYSSVLLSSNVIDNVGNEILKNILKTGEAAPNAQDNYSVNYRIFQRLLDKVSLENPFKIYDFIFAILNQAVVLPIISSDVEMALTIFSTLNNRGLPLSDADIFKAKIYGKLSGGERDAFIEKWKNLETKAERCSESIQQLFYYYMFYLRACSKDTKSTTPGVRRYFLKDNIKELFKPNLLDDLDTILNLWNVINNHGQIDGEQWSQNIEIIKALDILSSYPNEFWKYPVIIYYLSNRNVDNFEDKFKKFLRRLAIELLTKYIVTPTINAVKSDIMKLNAEIIGNTSPKFEFKIIDTKELMKKLHEPHKNVVRMILKLFAYEKQDILLPEKWEIEHILPQKWQSNYFKNSEDEIKAKIENIGNKLPFEKTLNIVAGNGYFTKKKQEYKTSEIEITKELGESALEDWTLDRITERDIRLSDAFSEVMSRWNKEYCSMDVGVSDELPTAEQLAQIEAFKKKGWV